MTVKQLIEQLSTKNPDADIILSANNGLVNTYSLCDHLLDTDYEYLSNDFFGTPGKVDERVFFKESGDIVYVGSYFPFKYYKDFEDITLESLEDWWWKQYDFEYNNETFSWTKYYTKTKHIIYSTRTDELCITNWDDYKQYKSKCPTWHEFYTALNICNLHEQFNESNKLNNSNERTRNDT